LKVIQLLRSSPFGIEGSYLLCFRFQLFKPSLPIPTAEFRFIDPRKISHYLLRPLEESDKSEFLADAGYELADSQRLLDDIRTQLLPLDADNIGPFEYGEKFRIRGFLQGPNGLRL
jgi:hypothetical protein